MRLETLWQGWVRGLSLWVGLAMVSATVHAESDPRHFPYDVEALVAKKKLGPNTALAPALLGVGLAVLRAGAMGKTAAGLDAVLGFAPPYNASSIEKYSARNALLASIRSGAACEVSIAGRVWAQSGLAVAPEYAALLQEKFATTIERLDLRQAAKAARAINAWAGKSTQGRVSKLVDERLIGSAGLVLTNALYFRGRWQTPFPKVDTRPGKFTLGTGRRVVVPLMSLEGAFKYNERPAGPGDSVGQVVELPYAGGEFGLILALPAAGSTLEQLVARVRGKDKGIFSERWSRTVRITVPRFKIESRADLKEILSELGGVEAFSARADFSGITGGRSLRLGTVVQRVSLEVSEAGAEAAAATAAVMPLMTAKPLDEPVAEFRADRPFFYFLYHRPTQTVLLMGRVTDPR